MKQVHRLFLVLGIIFCLSAYMSKPAHAMEFRTNQQTARVDTGEVISGSLFTAGDTVEMDGTVEGDLYCAGKTVTIKGSVGGDVLCAGQTVVIDGDVGGSIRSAGQTITIDGPVGRNVTIAGQTLTQSKTSGVMGEFLGGGETIILDGTIGQSAAIASNIVRLNGTIGGDAHMGVSTLDIGQAGEIRGTLTYESDQDARVASGARISQIIRKPARVQTQGKDVSRTLPGMMQALHKPWPMNAVNSIIMYLVLGGLGMFLFREGFTRSMDMVGTQRGSSALVGSIVLLTFPMIFVLLLVTIIGIPLAFLYALIVILIAWVSKLVVALFVGRELVRTFWKDAKDNVYLAVLLGVIVSWLVYDLPYVGWLIACVATVIGTGAIIKAFRAPAKKKK